MTHCFYYHPGYIYLLKVQRELESDLARTKNIHHINAIVTLNPREQLEELQTPELCSRVEALGMESYDRC